MVIEAVKTYPADFGKGGFVVSFIEKDEKWRQLTLDVWT